MDHAEYCAQFIPPHGAVLDVGSGKGAFAMAMAARGYSAYGIETNPSYREASETLLRDRGQGSAHILAGRGEALPFADATFDFVNCAEVTEHVDDPALVCAEIYRVLRPGGRSYISFHNRFGLYDYHYRMPLINWMPRAWAEPVASLAGRGKHDSADIGRQRLSTMHYYTYGAAARMLSDQGFAVADIRAVKIRGRYGRLSPIAAAVYRMVARPLYFNTFHFLAAKPVS